MKLNCEVIQDLLPLYEDGVCSPESRKLVEEHLKTCKACQALRQSAQAVPEDLPLPEQDVKAVKGFRKIRRRWLCSLLAVLLILPLLAMTVSQITGQGICFTNLDEIAAAKGFGRALKQKNYEKAASYLDFSYDYQNVQNLLSKSLTDYLPDWEPVSVDGQTWYAVPALAEELSTETDSDSLWGRLIYNDTWNILIPEALLRDTLAVEQMTLEQHSLQSGRTFHALETPWGVYWSSNPAGFDAEEYTQYPHLFDLLPEAVYEAILPVCEKEAKALYEQDQQLFGDAANLTADEFVDFMQKKYAAQLEDGLKDVTIDRVLFLGDATYNRDAGLWNVTLHIGGTYDEGHPLDIQLCPYVQHGKLSRMAGMYDNTIMDEPLPDEIWHCLFPGFLS